MESLVVSTQLSAVQVKQIRSQLATLTASLPPTLSPPPAAPLPLPIIVPLPVALPPSPIAPKIDLSPTISSAILPVDALAGIDLSLLAQLAKSGSLSNLFSATPSNSSPTELLDSWDKDLLALSLTLTNSSITKSLPTAASFLFDRLSLQCKQCGLRGFNCDFGQGVMDVHLDWHFVYKRRIREGGNRAQGRSWFSPVEVSFFILFLNQLFFS